MRKWGINITKEDLDDEKPAPRKMSIEEELEKEMLKDVQKRTGRLPSVFDKINADKRMRRMGLK